MADRRPGGRRPEGDRPRSFESRRPPGDRPPRREFGDRPPMRDRPYPDRPYGDRPPPRPRGNYVPRTPDEGGMSIRLDPRRLSVLRSLASEAGVRPGELVTAWLEERLDATRSGGTLATGAVAPDLAPGLSERLDALGARLDELAARVERLGSAGVAAGEAAAPAAPRRRGRPPGSKTTRPARRAGRTPRGAKVPLHDEIAAVLAERGPLTAAELAAAIGERGRYLAPRSAKGLDAAAVNSRVSNPRYRSRFARAEGRIGLAKAD